jgi:uncharacterized protein YunC (DUF1805 family)
MCGKCDVAVIAMVVAIAYRVMGLAIYINRSITRLVRTLTSVSERSGCGAR